MRTLIRVSVVVLVAVLLAACGDDDASVSSGDPGGGSTNSPPDDDPGDGTTSGGDGIDGAFIATAVEEGGQPRALEDGTTIRLRVEDGALTASAGCNTIGGDATVDDGVLRVGAVSTTEMGCDPPRHAQDEWLAGFLSAEPTVERTDTGFVLRTDDVTITFVDESVADPDRPLVGTTWLVDGYTSGSGLDGAVSSPGPNEASVVFGDEGFVTGTDGCNGFGYGGEAGVEPTDGIHYEVTGDRISFSGSAVSTMMGCPDHDPARFYGILQGTVTWAIDGPRLTLTADDGTGVMYRAKD